MTTVASARVTRNDGAVLAAAQEVLGRGWAEFSPTSVARAAGLSDKAVRSRGTSGSALARLLWSSVLGPALVGSLAAVQRALVATIATDSTSPLVDALRAFVRTDASARATVESLIIGRFDPELRSVIDADLGAAVRDWTSVEHGVVPATQAAYLVSLSLGLLLTAHYPYAAHRLDGALAHHAQAALSPSEPHDVPDRPARHMDDYPELAPGDPALDLLLNQTLELVGTHGFDGVTVMQIAASAGFTEGMVWHRYPTKLALFTDATRRQNEAGWQLNHDYVEAIAAEFPSGIAEAIHVREAQKPGREMARSMLLEQLRMAAHHPELFASAMKAMDDYRAQVVAPDGQTPSEAEFYVREARFVGECALPILAPDCWRLPYDVVTVPLNQSR